MSEHANTRPDAFKFMVLVTWDNYTNSMDIRIRTIDEVHKYLKMILNTFVKENGKIEFSISTNNMVYNSEMEYNNHHINNLERIYDLRNWEIN